MASMSFMLHPVLLNAKVFFVNLFLLSLVIMVMPHDSSALSLRRSWALAVSSLESVHPQRNWFVFFLNNFHRKHFASAKEDASFKKLVSAKNSKFRRLGVFITVPLL